MRILLVQPAPFEPGRIGLENSLWLSEPVALTSIARMIPEHEIKIFDLRLDTDEALYQTLREFQPDLVGTTSMTTDCYHAKSILEMAKQIVGKHCFTIVGGHHPTLASGDFENDVIDAICIGEGEFTFQELVNHLSSGKSKNELHAIDGLIFRDQKGSFVKNKARSQTKDLNEFPAPARHLIPKKYFKEYFFTFANPMASMETSRGCSFDCNFCAIWEFYNRKTRFLNAKTICDRLEEIPEKYVFFLDDNFLTNKNRLEEFCEEIKKRRIKKYYLTQGRTDFIADNPELMRKLRDVGFMMILSGYESNSNNTLENLRKRNTMEKNKKAAGILRKLGIISTGIFMVRQDFTEADFDTLYKTINEMQVANPIVTILTPLPGTQLFKKHQEELLTKDYRLFDLLHSVLPTKLPRQKFYEKFTEWSTATSYSTSAGVFSTFLNRPSLFLKSLGAIWHYRKKVIQIRPILRSPESHIRDEVGIITSNVAPNRKKAASVRPPLKEQERMQHAQQL